MGMVSFRAWTLYLEEKATGNHWLGGCAGPRAGTDAVAKRKVIPSPTLPGIEAPSSSPQPSQYTD